MLGLGVIYCLMEPLNIKKIFIILNVLYLNKNKQFKKQSMKKITLIITLLGVLIIANAQTEKKELNLTPEIEESMIAQSKEYLEFYYYSYCPSYGITITDKPQLENLHLGKPIPEYWIVSDVNRKLESITTTNVSRISDGEPLSLRFTGTWNVPVLSDETPLVFIVFGFFSDSDFREVPSLINAVENTIEHFNNYEHKDLVIGSVGIIGNMDYLLIQKENQDIFVQKYDKATGEYFKNEYSLSELINHLKEVNLREKEAQMEAQTRYYAQIANKSELKLMPEITKMVINTVYSNFTDRSDQELSNFGIKNRAQLTNLQLGKPIPMYILENENLKFSGRWQVFVMSDGEPLFLAEVRLKNDGQYRYVGGGSAKFAEAIHNYEHKDLIIGFLGTRSFGGMDYLMIRKEGQDIFVQTFGFATPERFKHEYSFSEIINLIKK
jgi:hypothetical protein